MKVLLLLVVVLAGVWLWRSRQAPPENNKKPPVAPMHPLDMVRCTQCGMHIPGDEVVHGRLGPYCSHEHLKQLEP